MNKLYFFEKHIQLLVSYNLKALYLLDEWARLPLQFAVIVYFRNIKINSKYVSLEGLELEQLFVDGCLESYN